MTILGLWSIIYQKRLQIWCSIPARGDRGNFAALGVANRDASNQYRGYLLLQIGDHGSEDGDWPFTTKRPPNAIHHVRFTVTAGTALNVIHIA